MAKTLVSDRSQLHVNIQTHETEMKIFPHTCHYKINTCLFRDIIPNSAHIIILRSERYRNDNSDKFQLPAERYA